MIREVQLFKDININSSGSLVAYTIGNDSSTLHGSVTIMAGTLGEVTQIGSTIQVIINSARPVEYKYKQINTSTIEDVWTPSSGKSIILNSLIVSTDGINDVVLIFGNSTLCHLAFNEKKSTPLSIPFVLKSGTNTPLKASVESAGTVWITAIGYEE